MPIKKRGGGGESFNLEPLPGLKPIPRNPNKGKTATKTPPAPKPQAAPKPMPKLTNVKRRQPMTSKYVYTDGGVLVIKAPASASKWDNEFRLRIIRDYKAPRTLTMLSEYRNRYQDSGIQEATYKVMGKQLRVVYPDEPIVGAAQTVVLRTDVINITDGQRLFLNHEEAAMRVLMVYCFLTGKTLGGVPKLIVDEYPTA